MHHTPPRLVAAIAGALLVTALSACSTSAEAPSTETGPPAEVTRLPTDEPTPTSAPAAPTPAGDTPSDDPDDPGAATDPPAAPAVPAPVGTSAPVAVTFSYWDYDTTLTAAIANGYADVVDAQGTCTLTLERNGVSVAVDRVALPDARTTSCGEMSIQDPRLTSGTWTARLSFSSPSHSGTSALVEIVVP